MLLFNISNFKEMLNKLETTEKRLDSLEKKFITRL